MGRRARTPMTDPNKDQQQSWHWLGWSIVLIFAGAVMMISLISSGIFDPKPLGAPLATLPLESVALLAGWSQINWLETTAPMSDHTLRLGAALANGEVDSAYGLVIGSEQRSIVIAVSPVGYIAIWTNEDQRPETVLPWQTWPHVAQNQGVNEIWVDVEDDALTTVRINREILWQGALPVHGSRVGTWSASYGKPSEINFMYLESFTRATSK